MYRNIRLLSLSALTLFVSLPLGAQSRSGLTSDLLRNVTEVEQKVVDLAKAMPVSTYQWRPGSGVRSTSEVFMHVASDNYLMPALMGASAPAATGITKEYKTAAAFEKRTMSRDEVIVEIEKSFAFLKASITAIPDAKVDEALEVFGQQSTIRSMLIMTVTHLHEHLGQLIAYARTNNVTPPWSK